MGGAPLVAITNGIYNKKIQIQSNIAYAYLTMAAVQIIILIVIGDFLFNEIVLLLPFCSAVIYLLILLYLITGIMRYKIELTNKQPFVSIIVAAHNESQNIKICLNSLLNQDYPQDRMEIIIVDDRSEDNTDLILKEYEAKHTLIRVIQILECESGLSPKKMH